MYLYFFLSIRIQSLIINDNYSRTLMSIEGQHLGTLVILYMVARTMTIKLNENVNKNMQVVVIRQSLIICETRKWKFKRVIR